MSDERKISRLGRIYVALSVVTFVVQALSLQLRHSVFGGTAWLATVKYEGVVQTLGFLFLLFVLCAALCGVWVLAGEFVGKLCRAKQEHTQRWVATSWLVILLFDLIFRLKVAEYLGSAFKFSEFASGVGGVWNMLVQAFGWYWDLILLSVMGLVFLGVGAYFFFKWFLGPNSGVFSFLDHIPRKILVLTAVGSFCACLFFMSLSNVFPLTRDLIASQTMVGAPFSYVLRLASDLDGDGFGQFDLPPDTQPLDPSAYPYALDIPDDGIDQDLLLGDLQPSTIDAASRLWVQRQGLGANASAQHRKNVVLIFMESVRHDMLSAEVGGRAVMPQLNALLQRGWLRIDRMFATRGFTQASVTQTFWGSLFEPATSLVDDFTAQGYRTVAISGESLLDEGFDVSLGWNRNNAQIIDPRHMPENTKARKTVPSRVVASHFEQFINGYSEDAPLFMYVFLQDPHFPYQQDNPSTLVERPILRSEITAQNRDQLWRAYANQVYHLDAALGRIVSSLEARGMLEDSLVVIVSDHGESLYDDGQLLGHGVALQSVMTHCAMAVWGASGEISQEMTHVDLRQFILDQASRSDAQALSLGVKDREMPLLQYIGPSTVPSAISFLYPNDERIVYTFATNTAYRESLSASYNDEQQLISVLPTELRRSPIVDALQDRDVQSLIKVWGYMQWFHRSSTY